jgi:hypothetical protein
LRHITRSGTQDLQGGNHLRNIITLARHTSDVQTWLPTREYAVVRACAGEVPPNLTIRVSGQEVDGPPPSWWPTTSTVTSTPGAGEGKCPAPDQGGKCAECRACWDGRVGNVGYRLH